MRLAAIDLGTNTIRLLVGDAHQPDGYRPVFATQQTTRLGQGLLPERTLKPEPMRRSLAVLAEFCRLARSRGAERVAAVGTSALRDAGNREHFLAAARDLGVEVRVVSGEEEARLTLLGVRASLPGIPGTIVMMDIGGGSTELLAAEGTTIRAAISTGLGSVALTEAYLRSDPPQAGELDALRAGIKAKLDTLPRADLSRLASSACLVGTAGTITTLAAIDLALPTYEPDRVNGHVLTRNTIEAILHRLAGLPLARRRQVRGLEPARADIIVAGAAVCLGAVDWSGFERLVVSDGGLREGILVDLLSEELNHLPRNVDKGGAIC